MDIMPFDDVHMLYTPPSSGGPVTDSERAILLARIRELEYKSLRVSWWEKFRCFFSGYFNDSKMTFPKK